MNNICLPWNGGDRLISLLDMKDYLASRLHVVCEQITACHICALSIAHKGDSETQKKKAAEVAGRLKAIIPDLDFLGLRLTKIAVERAIPLATAWGENEILDNVGEIDSRMRDELSFFHLLYMSEDERRYYDKKELFGEHFRTAFPNANNEITEAGSCFALGRYTASVFHLMRATESGLEAVYVGVGLPPLAKNTWSWHTVLSEIDKKIKENDSASTDPTWKTQSSFFRNAHGFLFAIKQPLRNETMHLETSYGEGEAERVFDAVRSFLTHLATRLKETP